MWDEWINLSGQAFTNIDIKEGMTSPVPVWDFINFLATLPSVQVPLRWSNAKLFIIDFFMERPFSYVFDSSPRLKEEMQV